MWKLLLLILTVTFVLNATNAPCPIERVAAAGQHVWLLCQQDELFVSPDGGLSWQHRRLPAGAKFRAAALLDSRRGFVAGDGGILLASEDAGETWRQVPLPVKENLTSIHFVGELGWISGWAGLILHSQDDGKTWTQQNSGVSQALECVYFTDAVHGWAVGWMGIILRTVNGGKTWEKARTRAALWSLSSVYFRDKSSGWAVGFNGQILRSRDGGITWEEQTSPVQAWLTSVLFDSSGRGWITADNQLLLSEDGGESWKAVPVQSLRFLQQLLPLGDSLWAVGRFGVLERKDPRTDFRLLATLPQRGSTGS